MQCVKHKMVLLGDSGVGKTSLIRKLLNGTLDPQRVNSTVYIDIIDWQVSLHTLVKIYDMPGDILLRSLVGSHYRNSKIIVFMYSLDRKSTFNNLKDWHKLCSEYDQGAVVFLVGNKSDMATQSRQPQTCLQAQFSFQESFISHQPVKNEQPNGQELLDMQKLLNCSKTFNISLIDRNVEYNKLKDCLIDEISTVRNNTSTVKPDRLKNINAVVAQKSRCRC